MNGYLLGIYVKVLVVGCVLGYVGYLIGGHIGAAIVLILALALI